MAPIASPIDKIVFGRLYDINEWLTGAYQAVCTRLDALTLEEGKRLGVDDAIRINSIRQDFCFVRVSEASPKLCEEDIESRFGLAIQTEHSSNKESKDVAERLRPDSAAEATSKKEEAASAAKVQRKKRQEEVADKKAKDLEEKKVQEQREAEAKSQELEEEVAKAAEIERQKKEQETADKTTKDLDDKRAPSTGAADLTPIKSSKKDTDKAKPAAAMSGISTTPISTAANEQEDWSQLNAWDRYCMKEKKFLKEKDAEELAELVKQMKQQLADEAKAAEGAATQQGAGDTSSVPAGPSAVSITEPNGSGVSNTSMGTPAIKKDGWSHLTPKARMDKKTKNAYSEFQVEERAELAAELLKKAQQQMADEAKAAQEAAAKRQ
ncbi:hypothetical protein FIBSPDRAFT_147011 [Athelia psychrophila]|uniref:Uncharacterized protein n=1 Tax=Athelia psychrophila TaxID=1759441 RepID=A0A166BUK6_9AGAM|nr:hypothetical protein FIBSPDRAFT_147011 [Fibularhizoctonia sp. CBS 109695]